MHHFLFAIFCFALLCSPGECILFCWLGVYFKNINAAGRVILRLSTFASMHCKNTVHQLHQHKCKEKNTMRQMLHHHTQLASLQNLWHTRICAKRRQISETICIVWRVFCSVCNVFNMCVYVAVHGSMALHFTFYRSVYTHLTKEKNQ